ncbi:2-polyprenyl-6-methoxyphenol hydroxylase-like FAD-dependent oxidoreductase [Murinocardiopsis flavida]|uniref:2-polyprenyl-6-methoxyphenol hydroxylase-like FAD-dependent oxidoreductase n=1 Tax=Murinocardiopsis flavida TaxID=645275 RepID=A0A2P8CCA5_9ACTN|nr:styrene monooxygenase/indole monooxygenase family protein [Murinocardiopsis flavida]PSK82608.1 2-polyprenyl-6-methoxyphenol hydroxylase-like FAD-dependent oxidoreductase [Murinocardiopsis flavida]
MRKILIVGAGQSGLYLAHGLLIAGYDVTMITGRTSTEIRSGRPSITQFTFPTVHGYEKDLGLDFWDNQAPHLDSFKVHLYPPQSPAMVINGRLDTPLVSVERRVKMADWLESFEDRGGRVVIHGVTLTDLDYFSRMYDLIVIAVGSGELGAMFDHDHRRFSGAPKLALSQAYIDDVVPDESGSRSGWVASTAELGGVLLMPVLTAQGTFHSLFIADRPGGVMDAMQDSRLDPNERLRRMKEVLRRYTPEFHERCANATLVDRNSTVAESIAPQVRHPVGTLPSGGLVLGIADVVITSNPFGAQGWNNSTRCAKSYLESIIAHGDRPFDYATLSGMFDTFWEYGQHAELWGTTISTMWDGELPPHIQEIVGAAMTYPEVANRWVQAWDYPPDYQEWLFSPEGARTFLAKVAESHQR